MYAAELVPTVPFIGYDDLMPNHAWKACRVGGRLFVSRLWHVSAVDYAHIVLADLNVSQLVDEEVGLHGYHEVFGYVERVHVFDPANIVSSIDHDELVNQFAEEEEEEA